MRFNSHFELEGSHAFLSASKYHWLRYSDERLAESYSTALAAARGTQLHELASTMIKLKIRAQRSNATFYRYVNDCIGLGMSPEVVLVYSANAFGTADAIKFVPATRTKRAKLLIFDLKTGVTKASFDQLVIYAAFFCLEYGFKPTEMDYDLRIYQNDEIYIYEENVDVDIVDNVLHAMDRIVSANRIIEELKAEVQA